MLATYVHNAVIQNKHKNIHTVLSAEHVTRTLSWNGLNLRSVTWSESQDIYSIETCVERSRVNRWGKEYHLPTVSADESYKILY